MNVLFAHDHILRKFNDVYYTSGGLNQEVLNRYIKPNDKIYVYTRMTDIKEKPKEILRVNNENIICEPSSIYHNPLDYYLKYKDIKNEAIKKLKDIDFCVIRLPSFIGGIIYKEVKRRNIPYIVEVVGCAWDSLWYYGGIKAKLFAPIMYYKTKKEIRNAKNVVYVTEEFLQKRYPTKGQQLACSDVTLPETNEKTLENRIRKILEKKEKSKIILGTIGNIDVKYKGHELVLHAIYELKKQGYNNIEYQLVGGGNGININKMAKKLNILENIKILGPIQHKEIFSWLDNIDVYIQPSYTEGLCRAVIEAMSRGCPCIVSNVGGNPELIEERYIIKKGSKKDLKNKILFLINNNDNMIESAKMNFERSKKFNNTRIACEKEIFYKKISK